MTREQLVCRPAADSLPRRLCGLGVHCDCHNTKVSRTRRFVCCRVGAGDNEDEAGRSTLESACALCTKFFAVRIPCSGPRAAGDRWHGWSNGCSLSRLGRACSVVATLLRCAVRLCLTTTPQDKGLAVTLEHAAAAEGDIEALATVVSAVFALCIQCEDRDTYISDICEMSEAHQTELMEAFGPFNVEGGAESEGDASDVEDDHPAAGDEAAAQTAAAVESADEVGAAAPDAAIDEHVLLPDAPADAHADGYESDDAGARAGMAALRAELSQVRTHLESAEARATAAEAAREHDAVRLQKLERAQRAEDAETASQLESAAAAAAQLAARDAELSEARDQLKRLAAEATQ